MKLIFIISIIQLVLGCTSPNKPGPFAHGSKPNTASDTVNEAASYLADSLKSFSKTITITVSYAAIMCGCPQWFEAKFENVKFLEGVERFYLEPISKDLINANGLWDGEHLPFTLKVTGRFSTEEALPITYHTKGEPEKARIFWYDKIVLVSPSHQKSRNK
jgi:hypothetical protein